MRTAGITVLVLMLLVGSAAAQGLPEPQNLREAQDDISYAELLNAAQFTPQQLDTLHRLQLQLQVETLLSDDLATALTKILAAVLSGMSVQEAHAALGEQQQVVQQAQQRLQQTRQQSSAELLKLFTDEQKEALVWSNSPAHALDGMVNAVAGARAAEDAQWNQFKTQASQGFSQMIGQAAPGGGATAEQIAALLDAAREMDDATFEARRATLAREWLPTLMPNIDQMLKNPQFRQQQIAQACQRLLGYPRGHLLVQAKRDAMGTQ